MKCLSCLIVFAAGLAFAETAANRYERVHLVFEAFDAGPLSSAEQQGVQLKTVSGSPEIISHVRAAGGRALALRGGRSTVEMTFPPLDKEQPGEIAFNVERWTSRVPFQFSVQARTGDHWVEVFDGTDTVPVGSMPRFRIPTDGGISGLRFTCTSPDNAGVLLNAITVAVQADMEIVAVEARPYRVPILVGRRQNPVYQINIKTTGSQSPLTLDGVEAGYVGDPALLTRIDVLSSGQQPSFAQAAPLAERTTIAPSMSMPLRYTLESGDNYFWVSAGADAKADVSAECAFRVARVRIDGQDHRPAGEAASDYRHRFGIALRSGGDDGSHTYRIPGLTTTNNGTLIAVYDVRWDSRHDVPANIDIGMSRSTDGGQTWEPMRIIMDKPLQDDPEHGNGVSDPAVLVDRRTNTVWVAALWSFGDNGWHGSGPGMTPEETMQLMLVKSEDDGRTWSSPVNITRQIKQPEWHLMFNGPGKGIMMRDGTLVFAGQFKDADGLPHSTIIYSRDQGQSWHIGTGAHPDTTEAQVVELLDGSLMLNMRDNQRPYRSVAVTDDLGKTWTEHPTSGNTLAEPVTCMASIIRLDEQRDNPHPGLFFSNPAVSDRPRRDMTVKYSPDEAMTWPEQYHVLLDEGASAGYSCLTMIDAHTVGILYESSQAHLVFQRLDIHAIDL